MSETVLPIVPKPRPRGFFALVAVLILAEIVSAFELSMMYVALPTLIVDFQADTNTVAWVVTAYLLVSASCAALGGRLGDMYGRKRVLIAALAIATLGSVVSLVGGNLAAVIVGRGIQGAAGAVMGLAFGLLRQHIKGDRLPVGLSMIGASALIAGSFGAFISGFLIDAFSWHGIFVFAAIIAVIGTIAVAVVVPRDPKGLRHQQIDVLGAVLLPVAVSALLLGLSSMGDQGFGARAVVGLTTAAVVAAIWIFWELRVRNPIINVRMIGNRHIALVMLVTFVAAVGPIGGATMSISLIQQYPQAPATDVGLGLTPTLAGLLSAATAFVGFAVSPVGGVIARKVGARVTFVTGILVVTLPLLVMILTYGDLVAFVACSVFVAIGVSLFFGALPLVLFEAVPMSHSSEVTGANTMVRNIGQSTATAVAAFILAAHYDPETQLTATGGFTTALLVCAGLGLAAVVCGLFLRRDPTPWVPPAPAQRDADRRDERVREAAPAHAESTAPVHAESPAPAADPKPEPDPEPAANPVP